MVRGVASIALAVYGLAASALAAQGRGSIAGTVQDSSGLYIPGAEVTVLPGGQRAVSSAQGAFRLDRIAPGITRLHIRRLGFAPAATEVNVSAGQTAAVTVRLSALAYALGAVEVRERRQVYDSRLAGFNRRREKGVGYFFTREQLDRRSHNLADVLREVPGVRITPIRSGRTIRMRGNCPALFIIDGSPAGAGAFDVDMVDLSGYEAVEVYSSSASVPPDLMMARGIDRCGVVALWSRPYRQAGVAKSRRRGLTLDELVNAGSVFQADDVDQQARLVAGTLNPQYPESLWDGGVRGRVLLEFVVAEDGTVEPTTATVVTATDPAFSAAAKSAIIQAQFAPAVRRGRAVRQIVHLTVNFEVPAS